MDVVDLCSGSDESRPPSDLQMADDDSLPDVNCQNFQFNHSPIANNDVDINSDDIMGFEYRETEVQLEFVAPVSKQGSSGYFTADNKESDLNDNSSSDDTPKSKTAKNKKYIKDKNKTKNVIPKTDHKIAKERDKAIRKANRANNKNLQRGECMKHISVKIASTIANTTYFSEIVNALQSSNVKYSLQNTIEENCITWSRNLLQHSVNNLGEISVTSSIKKEPFMLILIDMEEMEELLKTKTLNHRMNFIKETNCCQLTILLFGSKKYFSSKPKAAKKSSSEKITENDLEYYVTELLFKENVSCIKVETNIEMGQIVYQYTKSVAEIPFKQAKNSVDEKATFYMRGDNKGCIQTDKEGNGLAQLWCKSITKFPMVTLEVANAIVETFPTPNSLMKAIKTSEPKAVKAAISETKVRRCANTAVATSRRVGGQLADKIYDYFETTDGDKPIA